MSHDALVVALLVALVFCSWFGGYFTGRSKSKTIGTIRIEKNQDPNGMDAIKFDFGIASLEELYSMKECVFVIEVTDRITNSSDNDNT